MTTPPEALREMGADFIYAADALAETMRHLEQGMEARLKFLRRCVTENTARLAALREEIRTLPEQIAKWDAEAARLESQTAEDLLRQALEAKGGDANATRDNGGARDGESTSSYAQSGISPDGLQVAAPSVGKAEGEPYRAGLPPERLRKVWAEWEMVDGVVYVFQGNKYRCAYRPTTEWWDIGAEHTWRASYRPHGKSWSEVEAMADAAEKPAEPKMLDLTKLPPGTVCEATGEITWANEGRIQHGQRFVIATQEGFESQSEYPVLLERANERGDMTQGWCRAEQPARVVEGPHDPR